MTGSFWFLVIEWALRLAMLPIVIRRRRPVTAITWLCIIYFEPIVGTVIYWLFGDPKLPRKRIREHERVAGVIQTQNIAQEEEARRGRPPIPDHFHDLMKLSEQMGHFPCVIGSDVTFMTETQQTVDRLIEDIDNAEHHAHLLFYIFEDDSTGQQVVDALVRATKRGVKCRVLADEVGSWSMFRGLGARMRENDIELHPMLPVNPVRRRLARVDLRNHRKLAIIDGTIAYTGSQNIVHPGYGRNDLTWHDLMIRMTGPIVRQMQLVFIEDWYYETHEKLPDVPAYLPDLQPTGDVAAQAVPSGPTSPNEALEHLIVSSIHHARQQVTITTPYLVPNVSFLSALEVAALRGVELNIVVPRKSDHKLVTAACRAYYRDMLDIGVNLYIHQDGMLHAKTMVIDDTLALVGSGNFDIRSFRLNFELNLLLYGHDVTQRVREIQSVYIQQSEALDLETWQQRPQWDKFKEDAAKLLSPLL